MRWNKAYIKTLVAMCFLASSSVGILINSVGVFYGLVSDDLGILRGSFAMHVTVSTIVCALVSFMVPKILKDKNFKKVIFLSVLLASISTAWMAWATQLWQFMVLGVIRGIGNAFFGMVPITIVINNWFIYKHGFATSVALSFGGISGALFSPLFTRLIEIFGWQVGYLFMGVFLFILCMPFFLLRVSLTPEYMGLNPLNDHVATQEQVIQNKKVSYVNIILLTIVCILVTALTAMPSHFTGFSDSIGLGNQLGSFMVSLCMFGNIISKLMIGSLSDAIGAIKATILMIMFNILACLILLSFDQPVMLLIASFIFGSVYSVTAVGMVLLTKQFFGNENYDHYYPLISFGGNAGFAVAGSMIGYLYDAFDSYSIAFIIEIFFEILSLVIIIYMKKKGGSYVLS